MFYCKVVFSIGKYNSYTINGYLKFIFPSISLLFMLIPSFAVLDLEQERECLEDQGHILKLRVVPEACILSYMTHGLTKNLNCRVLDKYCKIIICCQFAGTFGTGRFEKYRQNSFVYMNTVEKLTVSSQIISLNEWKNELVEEKSQFQLFYIR